MLIPKFLTFSTLIALSLAPVQSFAQENGESLFEQKCSMCHLKQRPSAEEMKNMIAPPMMGVMRHVKQAKPDRAEAIAFIADYLEAPAQSKALCMPQSIARFGLMPSQKGNLTPEEAQTVAAYVYDTFGPRFNR